MALGRPQRTRRTPRGLKVCRIEQLEARHCLSGVGPGVADSLLAVASSPALAGVAALVGQPLAQFRLEAEDLNNHPVDSVDAGQDFKLAAFVTDLRDGPNPYPGVWAAFMSVSYDANLVWMTAQPNSNPANGDFGDLGIEFGDYFDHGLRTGNLSRLGRIEGIGAASLRMFESGTGPVLLWRITVHANAGGLESFEPSFDSSVGHESLFLNPTDPITESQIEFVPLNLQVVGPPPASAAPGSGDGGLSQIGAGFAPGDHALTTNSDVQQMPSVAVDPRDANHVVVAYMDYSLVASDYAGIGVAVSHDGGSMWQNKSIPLPADFEQGAANPNVKFDDQGHVFVSFMAATFKGEQPPITNPGGSAPPGERSPRSFGFQANNGIFVSRSDDGGLSWQSPVSVASNLYDQVHDVPFEIMPDLAVDTFRKLPNGQPNPNYGSLYVVWSRYYPKGQYPNHPDSEGGSNIMLAVSRDGGKRWQTQLQRQGRENNTPVTAIYDETLFTGKGAPEGQGYVNWSHVTIGPEGDIYVSEFLGNQFAVHHSFDGGRSFSHPDPNTGALYPFGLNINVGPGPLNENRFRLQVVRAIVADPQRAGTVYVTEGNQVYDSAGAGLDEGEVVYARSTDYGVTWNTDFRVGGAPANVINDDNNARTATGTSEVAAGQALPRMATDAQGNLAVIWYDTRRDPADHLLDVYGAVSSDGGQTFSGNFRVTNQSFDADKGKFTDAAQKPDYYLGDFLGLAVSHGVAYAAWTDTRGGNQDIFFRRFSITPPPAPANDHFEPNDTRATATDLGRIVSRDAPNLVIAPGDDDWFQVETASTGNLTINVTHLATPGNNARLELFDASGTTLLATGTAIHELDGVTYPDELGQTIVFPSAMGQKYLVHVVPSDEAGDGPIHYALDVRSLTGDFGTAEYGAQRGQLAAGEEAYYALATGALGSLEVNVTPGTNVEGSFRLEVLDSSTLEVIATGQLSGQTSRVTMAVTEGQSVFLHVVPEAGALSDFLVYFTNLDQYTTQYVEGNATLFSPTRSGPSESALADLNGDGAPDIVVSHVGVDVISVLLNNGDGTFRTPREFTVGAFQQGGPFTLQGLPNFHRDLAIADFNRDGFADVAVVNTSSSDVSILLGLGDGSFAPQLRFDATEAPYAMAVGDFNNDGIADLAAVDSTAKTTARMAVLLGRGDGTFRPAISFSLPNHEPFRTNSLEAADLDHDGNVDLVERDFVSGTIVLLGNGDGTFQISTSAILPASGPGLAVADLDGDGQLDVVATKNNSSELLYKLNHGKGTFDDKPTFSTVGQFPVAVTVADFGSPPAEGSTVLGPPDGHPDLIVANNGHPSTLYTGPAEVVVLPGLVDEDGQFDGFGDPVRMAFAEGPLDVKVRDVNGDKVLDIVVVDRSGILVIFGEPPILVTNGTPQTSRDLGTVVHLELPTLSITPGHSEAWYRLQVPTEAFAGAGPQVLDFSAGFEHVAGAGLQMDIFDRLDLITGSRLGSGDRVRVVARQGETLFVHIYANSIVDVGGGIEGGVSPDSVPGTGTYTLVIDTLPQVAAVEAQSFLPGQGNQPGGPTTSLVLVLQGDRLDLSSADNPANYGVTWLGPDGIQGTEDDREIAVGIGLAAGSKAVIYDPSSNVDLASGKTYATAVRQTVTLLFGQPLPAGSYRIKVSPHVVSAPFNQEELRSLSEATGFTGHPVVSIGGRLLYEGAMRANDTHFDEGTSLTIGNLVRPGGTLGDLAELQSGTRFLTQFHNDLGALLDAQLTAFGDRQSITDNLLDQIVARFAAALGPIEQRLVSLAVIFLDPVSPSIVDPGGRSFTYNLQTNAVASSLPKAFVDVRGNVEVVVIANPSGIYQLHVDDVGGHARGGVVYFGGDSVEISSLTDSLRTSVRDFSFEFGLGAIEPTPSAEPLDAVRSGLAGQSPAAPGPSGLSQNEGSIVTAVGTPASELTTDTTLIDPVGPGSAGDLASKETSDPLQSLLDLLSDIWNELNRTFLKRRESAGGESLNPSPGTSLFERILRIRMNLQPNAQTSETDAKPSPPSTHHRQAVDRHNGLKPPAPGQDESASSSGSKTNRGVLLSDQYGPIAARTATFAEEQEQKTGVAEPSVQPGGNSTDPPSTSQGSSADDKADGGSRSNGNST